jgi:type II secretory pathway component PulJ
MKIERLAVGVLLLSSACAYADDNHNPACKSDKRVVGACFTVHGRLGWWNDPPTRRIEALQSKRTLAIGEDTALPEGLNRWQGVPDALAARMVNYNDLLIADFEVCPLTREEAGKVQTVCVASVSETGASAEIRDSPAESQIALDRARQQVAADLARALHIDAEAARQMTNAQLRASVHQFAEQLRTYGVDEKVEALQFFQRIQGDTLREGKAASQQLAATGKTDLSEASIDQQMDAFMKRMQAAGQEHFHQVATQYAPTAIVLRDELLRRLGQKMPEDPVLVYVWDAEKEGQFQAVMSDAEHLNQTGFEPTADFLEGLANQLPQ